MDRIFLIRALSLYLPLMGACAAWLHYKPTRLEATGAVLATAWNLPMLLALNVAAAALGWWRFDVKGAVFMGVPVDLWMGWAVLWGAPAALFFRRAPLWIAVACFAISDLALMPLCSPVLVLGRHWFAGEALALLTCLLPAHMFARWTRDQAHVYRRAFMQFVCFSGLLCVGILVLLAQTGHWRVLQEITAVRAQVAVQLLFLIGLPGLSALQEFAIAGHGTPLPFDPPRRLVTSGIYSYVANPMQTSTVLLFLGLSFVLHSVWLAMAAAVSFAYCAGLAAWDEGQDLKRRFGADFILYRHDVRDWLPRWRPYIPRPARIYLSEECFQCSQVAGFLARLNPVGLEILPAEEHPARDLERMAYESHDGSIQQAGIAALARAFEHVNLAWALLGMAMRLPLICMLLQAIADVSGGGPRRVGRRECTLGIPERAGDVEGLTSSSRAG